MNPLVDRQTIIPMQDLELILPAVLGDQKPALLAGSLFSTNGASENLRIVHVTPLIPHRDPPVHGVGALDCSGGSRSAGKTLGLAVSGSGTVTTPRLWSKVRVSEQAHSSQSQ